MNIVSAKKWASALAFVFLSSLLVVTASERVYWYLGGIGFEENIGIAIFYMIPTLAALWAIGSGGSDRLHQMVLAGAVFGFVVEGVLTVVIYEDGPLPILAALFVGWHGLLSVVGLWYLARKWLLERRRRHLSIGALAVGVYWGVWSIAYRAPDAFADLEQSFSPMEPAEFFTYSLVVGLIFAAAHWLIGFVWPERFEPGSWGRRGIVILLLAYASLAVIPVVPWAPIKFAVLVGGTLWLLRRSRLHSHGSSAIALLQGRALLRDVGLLMIAPIAASLTYAGVWALEPSDNVAESIYTTFSIAQVVAGLAAFAWAARRSLRTQAGSDTAQPAPPGGVPLPGGGS